MNDEYEKRLGILRLAVLVLAFGMVFASLNYWSAITDLQERVDALESQDTGAEIP